MSLEFHLSYGTVADIGPSWSQFSLDRDAWTRLKAIELLELSLSLEPWFNAQFEQRGISTRDVLHDVKDLDEAIQRIDTTCAGRKKPEKMRALGQRMLDISLTSVNSCPSGDFKRAVSSFVTRNAEKFHLDLSS